MTPIYIAFLSVTILTAVANAAAAVVDFARAPWVLANMSRAGVPESWLFPLGVAKGAAAVGLLVGIAVPAIGVAAAVGLVLYFVGAIVTALRARWPAHLPYPTAFLALAVGALVLRLAV